MQEIAPVDIDTDSSLADDAPAARAQSEHRTQKSDVMIRDSLQQFVREAQEELNQV